MWVEFFRAFNNYCKEECNSNASEAGRRLRISSSTAARWIDFALNGGRIARGPSIDTLKYIAAKVSDHALGRIAAQLVTARQASDAPFDLREHAEKILLQFKLNEQKKLISESEDEVRSVYFHAALALNCQDFPLGDLKDAWFKRLPLEELQDAAGRDLLYSLANAEYFNDYARSVRLQLVQEAYDTVPVHPLAPLGLNKGMLPETWEAYRDRSGRDEDSIAVGDAMQSIYQSPGRGVEIIFGGNDLLDLAWKPERESIDALLRQIKEVDEASGRLLYRIADDGLKRKNTKCRVPEPDVVAAAAATASCRATIATIEAANALQCIEAVLPMWMSELSRLIGKLCHFVYLDRAGDMGELLGKLPEDRVQSFESEGDDGSTSTEEYIIGDQIELRRSWYATQRAISDTGAWFILMHDGKPHIAFMSSEGSICKESDIVGSERQEIHRFGWNEEAKLPSEYIHGTDFFVTMNTRF